MGQIETVLITGAAGFIGRATVVAARLAGLKVVAVTRRDIPEAWQVDPGITPLVCDLAAKDAQDRLASALPVDAVIHAAAHLGDDPARHEAETLTATRNVLAAMPVDVPIVLVSSISVYDAMPLPAHAPLTEDSALQRVETARDAYSAAKLQQEAICAASGHPVWMLRAGAVYGAGRTWHAHSGPSFGPVHMVIASDGEVPLTHVTHLANALIAAAMADPDHAQPLNVVDDDLPTRLRFLAAHRKVGGWPKIVLPMPWRIWLGLSRLLKPVQSHLPGLLCEPTLRARVMPLTYPNARLRAVLGGADSAGFEQLMEHSIKGGRS
ncbi:NAD-dependent epimerase/dehydratase family protein [Pseudoprimorskyibacter insulae]|uniref:NAD-dependent epimerase/dehydratase domain-containing protein n=1 Tax=Pseudoprimorskyibacter insulae TaxID=1695997 RepID=A0A2R8ATT1_9RHOB|nr:NAD(P)-dependent oxidoreductase [Pseudoprimorskyibacter insulae]SPF79472.1 hypothetical protein PRI8871_01268 [Pseudoprimorskyibacter insulae]